MANRSAWSCIDADYGAGAGSIALGCVEPDGLGRTPVLMERKQRWRRFVGFSEVIFDPKTQLDPLAPNFPGGDHDEPLA